MCPSVQACVRACVRARTRACVLDAPDGHLSVAAAGARHHEADISHAQRSDRVVVTFHPPLKVASPKVIDVDDPVLGADPDLRDKTADCDIQ